MKSNEKMELKELGIMSVAKINGIITGIMGFFVGIIYGVIIMTVGMAKGAIFGVGMGILAIIGLPILYGIMGFVFGAIGAALYNVIAAKIGGIEMEFKK